VEGSSLKREIFVSYSRKDVKFVNALYGKLKKLRFDIWQDIRQLRPGDQWQSEIDASLRDAYAIIVVLSRNSVKSAYVTYEWAFALGAKVRVIPLLLEKADIHGRLSALHYVDCTNKSRRWRHLDAALHSLRGRRSAASPAATRSHQPKLRAEFDLTDDGEPDKVGSEYVINLWVEGAPERAKRAQFEVHDDTFKQRRWTEKNRAADFRTWMQSYGNALVTAELTGTGANAVAKAYLYDALRRTHGRSRSRAIQKALNDIKAN
jgi:TIR domain